MCFLSSVSPVANANKECKFELYNWLLVSDAWIRNSRNRIKVNRACVPALISTRSRIEAWINVNEFLVFGAGAHRSNLNSQHNLDLTKTSSIANEARNFLSIFKSHLSRWLTHNKIAFLSLAQKQRSYDWCRKKNIFNKLSSVQSWDNDVKMV